MTVEVDYTYGSVGFGYAPQKRECNGVVTA